MINFNHVLTLTNPMMKGDHQGNYYRKHGRTTTIPGKGQHMGKHA